MRSIDGLERFTFEYIHEAEAKAIELGDTYGVMQLNENWFGAVPVDDSLSPFEANWYNFCFTNISICINKLTVCSDKYAEAMSELIEEVGPLEKVFHTEFEEVESRFKEILSSLNQTEGDYDVQSGRYC